MAWYMASELDVTFHSTKSGFASEIQPVEILRGYAVFSEAASRTSVNVRTHFHLMS